MNEQKKLWHPAFNTVLAYIGVQVGLMTMLSYSASLFMNVIAEDLNTAVGTTQLRFIPSSISTILLLPFCNRIYNKLGFKQALSLGAILYALGYALMSWAPNVIVYILCGIPIGLGTALALFFGGPYMLNAWFDKGTAIAIAIPSAVSSLTASFVTPVIQNWIVEWGWRAALRTAGFVGMAISVVFVMLFASAAPETRGLRPYGWKPASGEQSGRRVLSGVRKENVRKSPVFYMLFAVVMIHAFPGTIMRYIHPLALTSGFSVDQATLAVSLFSLATTVFLLVGSVVGNMLGLKKYTLLFVLINIGAYMLAAFNGGNYVLFCIGIAGMAIYGLGQIQQMGAKQIFGTLDLPEILPLVNIGYNVTNMLASSAIGYVYDFTGSYQAILVAIAVMYAISFGLVWLIFKKKETLPWEEKVIEAEK